MKILLTGQVFYMIEKITIFYVELKPKKGDKIFRA